MLVVITQSSFLLNNFVRFKFTLIYTFCRYNCNYVYQDMWRNKFISTFSWTLKSGSEKLFTLLSVIHICRVLSHARNMNEYQEISSNVLLRPSAIQIDIRKNNIVVTLKEIFDSIKSFSWDKTDKLTISNRTNFLTVKYRYTNLHH